MKLTSKYLALFTAFVMTLSMLVSCGNVDNEIFSETDSFVFFINVGKGDSILIKSEGNYILIDTGKETHTNMLLSSLKLAGVDKLEAVFITNSNTSHIGGLEKLSEEYDIGHVYFPSYGKPTKKGKNKIEKKVKKLSLEYTAVDAVNDPEVSVVGITFNILGPTEFTSEKDNNNSLVMKAEINGVKYLFTSDMQFTEEQLIFNSAHDLDCDILLVPNHGNSDATSEEFIKKCSPTYSIISTERTEDDNTADRRVLDLVRYHGGTYYLTEDSEHGILTYADENGIKVIPY